MARNKVGSTAGEMLGNLKSRLGFAHNESEDEEFARFESDFNDYDDFDDGYDVPDEYAYDNGFPEEPAPSATGGFRAITTRSGRFGRPDSTPNLVSIDDVREHSRNLMNADNRSSRNSNRHSSRRSSTGRSLVENDGPAPSSPAYTAAQRESSVRSEGLNSLFESTSARPERYAATSALDGNRGLTVIKPYSYNDVEGMARALKAGDAVVLAMADTPEELFKRILDFSFGVASALEAGVDCLAPKVYVIVKGPELSVDERDRLVSQGVL